MVQIKIQLWQVIIIFYRSKLKIISQPFIAMIDGPFKNTATSQIWSNSSQNSTVLNKLQEEQVDCFCPKAKVPTILRTGSISQAWNWVLPLGYVFDSTWATYLSILISYLITLVEAFSFIEWREAWPRRFPEGDYYRHYHGLFEYYRHHHGLFESIIQYTTGLVYAHLN